MVELSSTLLLPLLFATGLIAGTVDAIAGGGGLISLPMLLGVGLPPHVALGTNKLQSCIGTFVATHSYYRHRLFSLKTVSRGLLFGFLGAASGAYASQVISSAILNQIIPGLLLAILIYSMLSPKLGAEDKTPRMKESVFYTVFGFALAFYDGFFGPGVGSFWVFSLTFFLGYNLTRATAYTKVFNLNSNIIATACFMLGQNVDYRIALCMAAGQLIGGKLGAHLAIRNGAKLIRPIFILVVSSTILVLVYRSYVKSGKFANLIDQFGAMPVVLCFALMVASMLFLYRWTTKKQA